MINLIEKGETFKSESEIVEILNKFISNIVKSLGIPLSFFNPIIENMKNPVFKAILKYKSHPSILAIIKEK